MKRKTLSALLAVLMLFALVPVSALADQPTFPDVDWSDDYCDAVEWAVAQGITNGYDDGRFHPENICTRAHVVTFLWRAMGEPEPETSSNPFFDVPAGSWYEKPVLWAVEQGIVNGYEDGTFRPDDTCQNKHILTFLWRAMGQEEFSAPGGVSQRFPDGWYSGALSWAESYGLFFGEEDRFDIDTPCTRASTMVYLYSVLLGAPRWNPTVIQRQVIFDEGAMCGVVLVGSFADYRGEDEYIYEREFWIDALRDADLMDGYPFLEQLPNYNIVQTGGGTDVYVIIPLDPDASVMVHAWNIDWDKAGTVEGYVGESGELLYENDGSPFLLCCGGGEYLPTALVSIVDSDGNVLEWLPTLSGRDGTVVTEADYGSVYDLTMYPEGQKEYDY